MVKDQDNWGTTCRKKPREVALYCNSPCSNPRLANQCDGYSHCPLINEVLEDQFLDTI
jgi:hypothetical protein